MTDNQSRKSRKKREKTDTTILIGNRIKSLRTKRRMSQATLAEKTGISAKYLGEVERGEANLSVELMNLIANALDAPLSAILETEHIRPYKELISEIVRLAPRLNEKDAQIVYRMVKMLTE